MPRFHDVARGAAARKAVTFTTLDGREVKCDVRVLLGDDDELLLSEAERRTKELGGEPAEGNSIYAFQTAILTVLYGCVDPSSPPDAPVQFFESVAEIKSNLDRDRIALLAEEQQFHQDLVSPRKRRMGTDEYAEQVMAHAVMEETDELPFERWAPVLRRSFMLFTARLAVAALAHKSPPGSATSTPSTDSSPSSRKPLDS